MRWKGLTSAAVAATALLALGSTFWSFSAAQQVEVAAEANPAIAPEAAPKLARSRIDKVTVYPTTALVSREVEVPPGSGLIELTVSPMPNQIIPSSLYSEAGEGLRVLTTRFSTRHVLEDTSEARRKLEAELERYQVAGAKLDSDVASIHKNMELLGKLEGVTERGKHTGDEVITMTKYVMDQRTELAKALVAVNEQKRLNNVQISFVQRKMSELGRGGGKMEREAVLVVERDGTQGGKVRLNYLVGSVRWQPEYKVRAKGAASVTLDYLANLQQHSGEDWDRVNLTLSTAQPMLNASPPELCMLQPVLVARGANGAPGSPFVQSLSEADGRKKAMESRSQASMLNAGQYANNPSGGANPRTNPGVNGFNGIILQREANELLNSAAAIEQNFDLMRSRREILDQLKKGKSADLNSDGPSVTYHLPNKLTVPSRNDEQVIEVVKLDFEPKFYYKTVPVLSRHVYRLADLTNRSEHILLPGEATMYQGTDFVGRMPMPLVAIGEEFTAGFGVDTQLQVQRQMMDHTRTTQGGNQVLKYDYRILISSFKNEPVKLQVWDRLPKGENESVGVMLAKTTPELCQDPLYLRESRPNNLLRWDVEVAPNCNGEKAMPITYEFRMELDRQMAITGFQSK